MKIKNLALAVAASLIASQSFALGINDSKNATLKLTVSGATAADNQFASYINDICQAATTDTFRNPADNSRAFSCLLNGTISGVAAGTSALIRKESGGSVNGVAPVANATTVNGIDLDTCTDPENDRLWACSNTTIQVPAEVGISDVEPELFTLTANGGAAVNAANLALLTVSAINAQTFGIVVTPDLRNALQAAQGLDVGSEDVADMPSLSSALITNIFAGRVANWSTLVNSSNVGLNATGTGQQVNNNGVEVCLRTPGSGTQAQFNAFYLGNACAYRGAAGYQFLGFGTPADGNSINNDIVRRQVGPVLAPPPYIHANTGSTQVGQCLTNVAAANRTAIGIQSLEKVIEPLADRNNFRYIAVDGVAPTLENLSAGLYRNWASLSVQWRSNVVTGTKLAAAQRFVDLAKAKGPIADFNLSLKANVAGANAAILDASDASGHADVGLLAFTSTANGNAGAFDPANPVFAFDKANGLGNPSTCALPRLLSNQKVDVSSTN